VRTLATIAVTLAVALGPAVARAQSTSDQATAEALFKQARDLMTAGHYPEACPKFAESQRLDPSAGTMLNLGTCYERNGQLASAWVTFKGAATAAQNANEPDRAKLARAKVADLEPKLATLTIAVAPAADVPGLVVKRDGEAVGRAGWGTPIPVDPGGHSIEASAPGRRTWQAQAVVEGPAAKASIEVPALAANTSSPVPAPPAPVPGSPGPETPPPAPSSPGSTQRVLGVVVAGVGLAGIAVGSVFGVLAGGHKSDAGPHCSGTLCDATGISDLADARTAATVSTIGFIAGGALLAGGVVLYLVAPRGPSSTGLVVAPGSAGSMAGLTLRGGW
jgi:serine/threonine-protein kinase